MFIKINEFLIAGEVDQVLSALDEAEVTGLLLEPINLGELLLRASSIGNVAIVKKLVSLGANDFSIQDRFGNTPPTIAACNLKLDLVRYFLTHGVSATDKDGCGDSILSVAHKVSNDKLMALVMSSRNANNIQPAS